MVRLKFFLFALLVIAGWAGALYALPPLLAQTYVDQGSRQAEVAAQAAAGPVLERRVILERVLFPLTADPAIFASAYRNKTDAAKALEGIRPVALALAPEELRKELYVGWVADSGALGGRGDGSTPEPADGLDLAAVAKSTGDGAIASAYGVSHFFASVTVMGPGAPEPKPLGTVVIGLPAFPKSSADTIVKSLNLSSLVVMEGDKVTLESGEGKYASLAKSVPLGGVAILRRDFAMEMGPLKLPVLTSQDVLGGSAPMIMASRQALPKTPFEVLAVVSLRSSMNTLGEAQVYWLYGGAILLGLSLVWLILMGGGGARAARAERAPTTDPAMKAARRGETLKLSPEVSASGAATSPLATMDLPPAPEPNPDDFQFGTSSPAPLASPPASSSGALPFEPPPVPDSAMPSNQATASEAFAAFDADRVPTRAYPINGPPPDDPFGPPGDGGDEGFNPDATRVAAVSDELLRASARASMDDRAAVPAASRGVSTPPGKTAVVPSMNGVMSIGAPATNGLAPGSDEAHFQDVFREFVSTRERCGEPADGLTYEKFAVKLKKNREQLIQKYGCRTVRFQVYVKEGKAALKATPVKD